MKTILKLFAALCLMALASSITLAATETIELGPAKVSIDPQGIGTYKLEKEDPISEDHKYENYTFTYQFFPADIKSDKTSDKIQIEVHKISVPQPLDTVISQGTVEKKTGLEHCAEKSDMMPAGSDIKTESYTIDGHKGLLITVKGKWDNPFYLAAYSPDQKKDGSGSIVVVVGSNLPWDTTKTIFESVKTQLV